ncbi:MAG: hypothetical protein JXQ66_02675 [Campylobacterales bacterium]|nr:hypothetical protein [Campylobacterales bacterium]
MLKDIKPVFEWAKQNGDANIYDRIIMKVMPELLKNDLRLTSHDIDEREKIEVIDEIYELILEKSQELVGERYV